MTEQIELLKERVKIAEKQLKEAEDNLTVAQALPENNIFESLEIAEGKIEDMLSDRAHDACEGSYCCGDNYYEQLFYVGDVLYKGIACVEYNRHDKTYYYVDGFDFRVEKVEV